MPSSVFVPSPRSRWRPRPLTRSLRHRHRAPLRLRWYKGNTHTHTLNSDGDSTPDDVVRWYREHGYSFVVLTDHNFLTSTDGAQRVARRRRAVPRRQGRRSDLAFERQGDPRQRPRRLAQHGRAADGTQVVDVLQKSVRRHPRGSGVPHINHPNFRWSITRDQLQQVRNNRLFEIYNGHPQVNNLGGGGVAGTRRGLGRHPLERHAALRHRGRRRAHVQGPGNPDVAGPGRGWVVVRAPRLDAAALLESLERGRLLRIHRRRTLRPAGDRQTACTSSSSHVMSSKYRVQFIARAGRVVQESTRTDGDLHVQGRRGIRARPRDRKQRPDGVDPAGAGHATH